MSSTLPWRVDTRSLDTRALGHARFRAAHPQPCGERLDRSEPPVTEPAKPVQLTVIDTDTAPWELFPIEYIKTNLDHVPLVNDPDPGMMVPQMLCRHGVTNACDSHRCARDRYVPAGQ